MTIRTLALTLVLSAVATASTLAQTPAAAAQPATAPRARSSAPAAEAPRPRTAGTPEASAPAAPAPERPRREGQPVNIKVDLTLTDQRGGAQPVKRTLTVLAADGYTGSIRTMSQIYDPGAAPLNVPLNVDASPTLVADGKIRLSINLQYDWPGPAENRARGQIVNTSLHDQLMMILENG